MQGVTSSPNPSTVISLLNSLIQDYKWSISLEKLEALTLPNLKFANFDVHYDMYFEHITTYLMLKLIEIRGKLISTGE